MGGGGPVGRQTLLMFYQIDWSRLLGVLLLLGAGAFITTHLAGTAPTSSGRFDVTSTSRTALRGMWFMTLLGLASGAAGALLENAVGQNHVVRILHGIYSVCWAPPFLISSLQQGLAVSDLSLRFFREVFSLLGVLLVPVFWFLLFLCVARVLVARRPRAFGAAPKHCKCDGCSKPPLAAESTCDKPAAGVPKRRDAAS
jgi:hypothetical protein